MSDQIDEIKPEYEIVDEQPVDQNQENLQPEVNADSQQTAEAEIQPEAKDESQPEVKAKEVDAEKLTEIEKIDLENEQKEKQELQSKENQNVDQPAELQEIDWNDPVLKQQQKYINLRNATNILSDIGFICLGLGFAVTFGAIFLILAKVLILLCFAAILVFLFIGTVGVIVMAEGYRQAWAWIGKSLDNENLLNFANFLLSTVPFVFGIGFVSLVLSIVFNCFAKNHRSILRLVLSSVCTGFLLFLLIMILSGVNVVTISNG